jgi:hypothetical protein
MDARHYEAKWTFPRETLWESGYSSLVTTTAVIKDADFKLLVDAQKPDSKKRLAIGSALMPGVSYAIYGNKIGQIILDPVVTISVSETRLFQNKKALASVKRGLRDSAAGRTRSLGSFAKFAEE